MRLVEVKLENFRGYRDLTSVKFNDLTVFIGKNDAGKSTVLEALDVFFNKTAPDLDDANVNGDKTNVRIACIFEGFPQEMVIDASNTTSLQNEYLLNSDGALEIHKIYDCSGSKSKLTGVYARANHPSTEGVNDLLSLTIQKLRTLAKSLGIDLGGVNETKSSELRKAIWSGVAFETKEVDLLLSKGDTNKAIWDQLAKNMPVYALFKSDRPSTDQDAEAQDPMKIAIKEALKGQEEELKRITMSVTAQIQDVAERTVEKISELAPELARQLTPRVTIKNWDTLFSVSLTGDEEIPINKRGSGVRRLILLNFFRAQAEKSAENEHRGNIIYAIEEPETSQHPHNQKMLLDAFWTLVESQSCQVMLTTHTPVLARCLDQQHIRYVFQDDKMSRISPCDDVIVAEIIKTLGVLPDHDVKAFLGVEGKHDISFIKSLSAKLNAEDPEIPNLARAEEEGKLVFIPLGGSSLDLWVDRINGLNRPQFYLMDRDVAPPAEAKYQAAFNRFTGEGHTAWITSRRELENFIHPDLIRAEYANYEGTGEPFEDVPTLLAKAIHDASDGPVPWDEVVLNKEKKKSKEGKAKHHLNNKFVDLMTPEYLMALDEAGEVSGWFRQVGAVLSAD